MSDLQIFQQARLSRDPRFDGHFFIAVKTTKIFCRSICPANLPLEKNVEYFVFAQQAMQKGYRPCLRCRPDSAPKSYAWQGTTTTVMRASQLLHTHLDLSISEVAEKLGIGERYFRQLFKAHVGLSPKQFQLYDQILLAKQLLHHSNLSIEQVAQSCGFNSARRLQIQMKQLCSLSPSQIRHQKKTLEQDIRLSVAFRAPYDWPQVRDFLALRAIAGIEQVTPSSYARFFCLENEQAWFKAEYDELHQHFKLHIKLNNISLLPKVIANIERMLDVNADVHAIAQRLVLSGVPPECLTVGLRLPGVWSIFEAGCRAILGQQISVKAAINLLTLLSATLGDKQVDALYFPSPSMVASSDLSFLKIPASRRNTLRAFAQWYEQHPQGDINEWINIKGIGPWTIAYAHLRGASLPDIWLMTDLVVKNQLKKYAIKPDVARPWRSYLTLQLWTLA
ncbi:Ada metal-binding domain-containing protein [Paraglaciecola sp. 25GB23A]|uniref:DNA-3-methyladenine glycosylase 2 family protein n=1 Tax=Paraglaciecola sp. 25GB23A TaxID=3156068 RepID=UPI0032AFE6F6